MTKMRRPSVSEKSSAFLILPGCVGKKFSLKTRA